jgi:hypothetical protein
MSRGGVCRSCGDRKTVTYAWKEIGFTCGPCLVTELLETRKLAEEWRDFAEEMAATDFCRVWMQNHDTPPCLPWEVEK